MRQAGQPGLAVHSPFHITQKTTVTLKRNQVSLKLLHKSCPELRATLEPPLK
jgi:hypothetical protein